MSQENQSYLRFSLEESVWFQKGQEVAELVSISLDPNITIVENDLYVAIRGSLELTGEYKRFQEEDDSGKEDVITTPKFIQSVEERDEGICEFIHRFPVDITIPNNRIQSVYDINVTVDSFDCLLPERSCLKLIADLTISGLYGEQQNVPLVDDEREPDLESIQSEPEYTQEEIDYGQQQPDQWNETEENQEFHAAVRNVNVEYDEEVDESSVTNKPYLNAILGRPAETEETENEFDDEIYKPFSAEAKKQPEIDPTPEYSWGNHNEKKVENNSNPNENAPNIPDFTYTTQRDSDSEPEQAPYTAKRNPEPEQSTYTAKRDLEPEQAPYTAKRDPEPEQATYTAKRDPEPEQATYTAQRNPEHEPITYTTKRDPEPPVSGHDTDYQNLENPVSNVGSIEESSSSSSPEQQKLKKKKSSKKKSMSIAEFLGRKTENEEHVKLKVCIVQNGETLDSLSERYELPIQQILRVNHLEASQDVYEGQVLYIPEATTNR